MRAHNLLFQVNYEIYCHLVFATSIKSACNYHINHCLRSYHIQQLFQALKYNLGHIDTTYYANNYSCYYFHIIIQLTSFTEFSSLVL